MGKTVYFLYSREQFDEKNEILAKSNKEFVAGTVIADGIKKEYTTLSTRPDMARYVDTRVIASGDDRNFVYTKPMTRRKLRG